MDEYKESLTDPEKKEGQKSDDHAQLPELTGIDMISSKVVELENSINQYKDQLLRKAAEFENYKKRVENDSSNIIRFANEDLIEKLLPVLDDFERSFEALKDARSESESFIKGVEMIYNKLKRVLDLQGIKPLEAVGKPFDPELHDALLQMPSADHPPHTVMQEVEKGYILNDRVIRHAKVIVSTEPQSSDEPIPNDMSESD
jgi:molecular chaperone GrpE